MDATILRLGEGRSEGITPQFLQIYRFFKGLFK